TSVKTVADFRNRKAFASRKQYLRRNTPKGVLVFRSPPLPEGYCNYEPKLKLSRKMKYETASIPPFTKFPHLPPVTKWRPSSLETEPRENDQADDSSSKRPKPSSPIDIPKRRRRPNGKICEN
ncbi:hypothetical protein CEXT_356251, partial [Caerostris extrusa]